MPLTPPYSSSTAAMCTRSARMRRSMRSAGSVSGMNEIARRTSVSDCRRLGGAEQVLDVDQSDDVVEVALAQREAGVAGAPRDLQVLFHRARGREVDHVGARHHDLARGAVRELEDVGEQLALLLGQLALLLGVEQAPDLLLAVAQLAFGDRLDAEDAQDRVGGVVEHPDHRVRHLVEHVERERHPQRRRLRLADRERLRRQLAEDDVEDGDDRERDDQAHGVAAPPTARRRSPTRSGSIRRANAGSPIQPRARLASVMPSWVADR